MAAVALHGTPITSANDVVLKTLGARDYLVSYHRPDQVAWVDENARTWAGDCGTFSFWREGLRGGKTGEEVFTPEFIAGYAAWCRRWCLGGSGRCKWVVIPDPIGAGTQLLDAFIRDWPADLMPFGVPVFHTDEPVGRLLRLIEQHGRVAIGAVGEHEVIGSDPFSARMDELWDAIVATFGETPWVHMFRSLQLLLPKWRWPFASHDSSDLGRNHHRLKAYGEHRLWAVKQKADRWDRLALERPTIWTPTHLRQSPTLFAA
jgi:hypothetical protein